MAHEQSETIQDPKTGKWINVYGRGTKKAGERLPDSGEYDSVDEAVTAAKERSKSHDRPIRYPATEELMRERPRTGADALTGDKKMRNTYGGTRG